MRHWNLRRMVIFIGNGHGHLALGREFGHAVVRSANGQNYPKSMVMYVLSGVSSKTSDQSCV